MLILEDRYNLIKSDFPETMYEAIFVAIDYLIKNGAPEIDAMSIFNFLSGYPSYYRAVEKNGGVEYIYRCGKEAQLGNFDYYYTKLKKLNLLNHLEHIGFPVQSVYDPSLVGNDEFVKMQEKFDSYTIEDIFNTYDADLIELKETFSVNTGSSGCQAAKGMLELKEQYKEMPEMGMPMGSPKLTTIFRGRRLKKLYLKTAPSGFGKCIVGDSLVYTGTGLIRIEEVPNFYSLKQNNELVGHVVSYDIDSKSKIIAPTSHWYNMGESETIKIKTHYGFELEGTPEHPIVVGDINGNTYFKKLKDVSKDDMPIISMNNNLFGIIDINEGIAYAMGLLIGKIPHKKISGVILQANEKTVVAFLQGMFDADGTFSTNHFEWSTVSKIISKEVHLLLLNMGIVSRLSQKIVNGKVYYGLHIVDYPMLKRFYNKVGFKNCAYKKEALVDFVYGDANKISEDTSYFFHDEQFHKSFNQSSNMFFDTIASIEGSKNIVYDFTVPVTHSFVSNGFISHNTRVSVGDACCVSIPTIWDSHIKEWVTTGCEEPSLIISTELEIDEIQTMIMAYVSDVPEDRILDGKYHEGEEERVNKAIDIITNAPLYIEHIPSFNIDDIEKIIKKYKARHVVGYVFFDYIFTSVKILTEIATKAKGVKLREDNVLIMFADRMKTLANTLNVHVDASTQANGDWKHAKDADQNLIRGAKGIADKVDAGYVLLPPSEKDKEMAKEFSKHGFNKEANLVFHIYKVRRGKINHVKLFVHFDYSTCRTYDLFVTTNDYELLNIENTSIEVILEKTETEVSEEDATKAGWF